MISSVPCRLRFIVRALLGHSCPLALTHTGSDFQGQVSWTGGREYKVVPNTSGSDRLLCANLTTGTATPAFDDTSDPYSFYINPLIGGRSSGSGSLQDQLDAWDAAPYDADDDGLTDSDDRAYIIYLYNFLNP
jgi:hypothetical protein